MRPIALAVIALGLLAPSAAAQSTTPADTTPLVSADGIGFATLTPDLADFGVSIRETARTSAEARDATNRKVAAVVRAATTAGVAVDDIRTVRLTVARERVKPKRRPAFIRYNARQFLQIRVRDVSKLGALLDSVSDAGADQVEAPDYGFADPSAGRLLATRAAIADARRRAEDAAAQQGMRITGVRSIVLAPDDDDGGGTEFLSTASAGGDSAGGGSRRAAQLPTSVAPGTQQFAERVRVVYTAMSL